MHAIFSWISLIEASLATLTAIFATWLSVRHAGQRDEMSIGHTFEPVSILKPLKGADEDLQKNLQSFFELDYPEYELIFSVADQNDPSLPVVQKLIQGFPLVKASVICGETLIGVNPKVNNLINGYQQAKFENILISDSNVIVPPSYLKEAFKLLKGDVGLVTAYVTGSNFNSLGGGLEATTLNTFCTRWMIFAHWAGAPVVMGKSMLFKKNVAEKFGGIKTLGCYLAEDYMAGHAMAYLGKKVAVMQEGVRQPLKSYTFQNYWSRHLRWGRLRKAQAPLAFTFEPLTAGGVTSFLAALSLHELCSVNFFAVFISMLVFNFVLDLFLMFQTGAPLSILSPVYWLIRELTYMPLWLHIACGNSVNWRGNRLQLTSGGLLK